MKVVSEDRAYSAIHLQGAVAKTKKATNILRPAIDVTFDKDAEFEVFSDSRRFFHGFFLEKVTLYGEPGTFFEHIFATRKGDRRNAFLLLPEYKSLRTRWFDA